jgi:hypothetical protein
MSTKPLTLEEGITSPEQEIKDVFKTATENKIWLPGEPMPNADWESYLQQSLHEAESSETISVDEARKRIEQLKAFQTHGT